MKALMFALLGVCGLLLCGCDQQLNPDLITKKYVIHMPPGKFFNCPLVKLPQTFVLDRDVAKTLVEAYNNNLICRQNMNALKADLQNQLKVLGNN